MFGISKPSARQVGALVLVVALALAGATAFTGGAAAVWSDNSSVDTSSTTSVSIAPDGTATSGPVVTANNTSVASADDLELQTYVAGTDIQLNTYTGFVSTANADEYELGGYNLTTDNLPRANDHLDVEYKVYDTAQGAYITEPAPVGYDFDPSAEEEKFIVGTGTSTSAVTAGTLDVTEESKWFGFGDNITKTSATGSIPINGSTSNVTMLTDGDVASNLESGTSDAEAGDIAPVVMTANDKPMLVFVDEAPDYAPSSYGVYDTSTGDIAFTLADEDYSDSDSFTYSLQSTNDGPDFVTLGKELGWTHAFGASFL